MEHIYLPVENVNDFACYSVYDKDTIRAYNSMPQINSSSHYVDFYINNHYLEKDGTQRWSQYTEYLPTCLSSNSITNDFYYRNDFTDILIQFTLIALLCIYLPFKLIVGRLIR